MLRASIAAALLAAGCGGHAAAPKPSPAGPARSTLVTPQATTGVVGGAERARPGVTERLAGRARIPARATHPSRAQRRAVGTGTACANADLLPSASNLAQIADATLCLVNGERSAQGLAPLVTSSQLRQASQGMADLMVKEQFFAHETPEGKTLVDRVRPTGYLPSSDIWVLGENLAWGSGSLSTPQAIVNGWMNSSGHRANILASDYKEIGLGLALGAPEPNLSGGTVYVTDFGARSGASASVASARATSASTRKARARLRARCRRARAARRAGRHVSLRACRRLRRLR